jgi:hypothetical protein
MRRSRKCRSVLQIWQFTAKYQGKIANRYAAFAAKSPKRNKYRGGLSSTHRSNNTITKKKQ